MEKAHATPRRATGLPAQWVAIVALTAAALAGCVTSPPPERSTASQETSILTHWEGRLALQISAPVENSFSAGFVLEGVADAGSLQLLTPLGNTAGRLSWSPSQALWEDGQGHREVGTSLDQLMRKHTGASLPVEALFSWLRGIPHSALHWQVDLSAHARGRIQAHYFAPNGDQATLRIQLAL